MNALVKCTITLKSTLKPHAVIAPWTALIRGQDSPCVPYISTIHYWEPDIAARRNRLEPPFCIHTQLRNASELASFFSCLLCSKTAQRSFTWRWFSWLFKAEDQVFSLNPHYPLSESLLRNEVSPDYKSLESKTQVSFRRHQLNSWGEKAVLWFMNISVT